MFGAGEDKMNSDSPSTFLFDSVALRYSASLWCVLLVGSAKWLLKKTGGVVSLDCPAGRNPLSNKADNLLCLSLIWLNFTCHTFFFSLFLFTYWLQDALQSILSSTQLCKFAIWACKLFFYSVFCRSEKYQLRSWIMHVCMCVSVCTLTRNQKPGNRTLDRPGWAHQ